MGPSTFAVFIALLSCASAIEFDCPLTSNTQNGEAHRDFCAQPVFNDVLYITTTLRYFFKGDLVALVYANNNSFAPGHPLPATNLWQNFPGNIDASFTFSTTGKTYFLKGSHYWQYSNFTLDPGFPRPISEGFGGVPDNVDAATEWDGKIYFFKDALYYRYDACKNSTYTGPTSDFSGLPQGRMDGVHKHALAGSAIFMFGSTYATFIPSANYNRVYPANPQSIAWDLLNCRW